MASRASLSGGKVVDHHEGMKPKRRHNAPRPARVRHAAITLVLTVASATAVAGFGFADLSRPWLVVGTLVLGAAAWGLTWVLDADDPQQRFFGMAVTSVALATMLAGVVLYSITRGTTPTSFEFMLRTSDEAAYLRPSGEPGGAPLTLGAGGGPLEPLHGGTTYRFTCKEESDDGSTWLRLESQFYWVPEEVVRPRTGEVVKDMPSC
jgi:hypothetical protein